MTEKWDFYQCRVNDKAASIYLDLTLKEVAPNPDQPTLLIVWVHLLSPHPENGLSTSEEFSTLVRIEDRLSECIARLPTTIYAGRITNDGRREFYFYGPSGEGFESGVQSAMSEFGDYRFEAWHQPDPEWNQYLSVLYPARSNLRWMADRDVISTLEKHGDAANLARPISHFSYFKTDADRSQFLAAVSQQGFRIVDRFESSDSGSALPFGLLYEKCQPAELSAIFQTTESLAKSSEFHGGTYDGWECPVITKPVRRWWQFWK